MADEKNYIGQINLGGTVYDLKDIEARADIADIKDTLTGGVHLVGETTTELTDGATTKPIKVNNKDYTQKNGDMVYTIKEGNIDKEFLWNGSKWIEMGDLSTLGSLAYQNSASGSYTPAGGVTVEIATSTSASTTVAPAASGAATYTPGGTVTVETNETADKKTTVAPAESGAATYTPAGTVTAEVATTTSKTAAVSPAGSGDATYTPAGEVTATIASTSSVAKTVSAAATGDATYTPAGTIQNTGISVSTSTESVYSITDVGTLPVLTTSVSAEVLTISFSQGTLPTKGEAQNVVNDATAAFTSAPTFSGTGVRLETENFDIPTTLSASFSGTGVRLVTDNIDVPATLSASFSGTGVRLETGEILVPSTFSASFSGTGVRLETGDINVPATFSASFSGTEATITVS